MFEVSGRVIGLPRVVSALNTAPRLFARYMASWLRDERARFVGGKDSKGNRRRGYRDFLSERRHAGRAGTWASQVAGTFKGHIPSVNTINGLYLRAGVGLNNPKQIHRALWKLQEGGSIGAGGSQMPIPQYTNLQRIGVTSGFWQGKAFKRLLLTDKRLAPVRVGSKTFWFDKTQRYKQAAGRYYGGYRRTGLLFIGTFGTTIKPQFTGCYDFYGRWERMQPQMIERGRGVMDRATNAVEGGRNE